MKEMYKINGIDWHKKPCRAIDTETKQLIKVFDSRTKCAQYFKVAHSLISNAIAKNGCIRVNGKRIAIRNYHG